MPPSRESQQVVTTTDSTGFSRISFGLFHSKMNGFIFPHYVLIKNALHRKSLFSLKCLDHFHLSLEPNCYTNDDWGVQMTVNNLELWKPKSILKIPLDRSTSWEWTFNVTIAFLNFVVDVSFHFINSTNCKHSTKINSFEIET